MIVAGFSSMSWDFGGTSIKKDGQNLLEVAPVPVHDPGDKLKRPGYCVLTSWHSSKCFHSFRRPSYTSQLPKPFEPSSLHSVLLPDSDPFKSPALPTVTMPHSKTPGGSGASDKFLKQQAESTTLTPCIPQSHLGH